jgi:hypothetical protein
MKFKLATIAASLAISAPAMAQDVTWTKQIAPLFQKACAECHGKDSPNYAEYKAKEEQYNKEKTGPRMSTYEEVLHYIAWPQTGAMMRRLDDGSGSADKKPGNMYKYLGETDAERAANFKLMKAWIGEDAWFLNRLRARGDVPAVTLEQLQKVKAKH